MKKLILIDGHALVHRAFHALPPTLVSPKGVLTNAVYGFTSVLIKTIKDLKPDYIVATFDLAGPTFRHEDFAEYKAHRQKAPDELHNQVPIIKQIISNFGIPIFEKEGYEADDLIGSVAEKTKKVDDLQTIIVTGDLDTLQLVEDKKVIVLTLKKGVTETILYDEDEVKKRYSLNPEQVVDFKGLKGDPSDNIPGVPGVGEKTASALIQKYKSLENMYEQISKKAKKIEAVSDKMREKLLENKDLAFFSKKLATIVRDVDIDFKLEYADWRKNLNKEKLEMLLKELGLYSLVKRLPEIDSKAEEAKQVDLFSGGGQSTDLRIASLSKNKTKNLLKKMADRKFFALDIYGGNLNVAFSEGEFFSVSMETIFTDKELKSGLKDVLENEDIKKNGHDLKEISKFFLREGFSIKGLEFDTKIAAYLLNSDRRDYSLEKIYFSEFQKDLVINSENRPVPILELKKVQWDKMKSAGLLKVFEDIEIPLSPILAQMEMDGIRVSLKEIEELSARLLKKIAQLEKEIYNSAGMEFNINSPQQLSNVLFSLPPGGLGLKGKVRKTGKGALSTAAPELEKLIDEHPIISKILEYREHQKMKTTYVEPFPDLVDKKDGRLHTTYNQTGTTTGRLSSQDPNLQNIPIRTELGQQFRKAFVADKGNILLSCDYSQLELRIAAHVSGDKKMSEAFNKGEDIHTRTAAEIFNVSTDKVTNSMRRQAKVLNFGLIYGMGILGFQRAANVDRQTARGFIDRYMYEFSGVAEYMENIKREAHKKEYVETIFGRRRWLPEINSGMPQLVAGAERAAINHPLQGTGADLIKLAMIEVKKLITTKYSDSIKMLLQVHDELLFEVKKGDEEKFIKEARVIMENVYKFNVPIIVDAKIGPNWAEMESIEI